MKKGKRKNKFESIQEAIDYFNLKMGRKIDAPLEKVKYVPVPVETIIETEKTVFVEIPVTEKVEVEIPVYKYIPVPIPVPVPAPAPAPAPIQQPINKPDLWSEIKSKKVVVSKVEKPVRDKHICCIYSITCLENGFVYIGSTSHYKRRKTKHSYDLRCGLHPSEKMQADFNLYGSDKFTFAIIKQFDCQLSRKDLLIEEESIISLIDKSKLYNKMAKVILFTSIDKLDELLEELSKLKNIQDFRIWKN